MSFFVGELKNLVNKKPVLVKCEFCSKIINPTEPIVAQIKFEDNFVPTVNETVHLSCFMTKTRTECKDFWKKYMVDLI